MGSGVLVPSRRPADQQPRRHAGFGFGGRHGERAEGSDDRNDRNGWHERRRDWRRNGSWHYGSASVAAAGTDELDKSVGWCESDWQGSVGDQNEHQVGESDPSVWSMMGSRVIALNFCIFINKIVSFVCKTVILRFKNCK